MIMSLDESIGFAVCIFGMSFLVYMFVCAVEFNADMARYIEEARVEKEDKNKAHDDLLKKHQDRWDRRRKQNLYLLSFEKANSEYKDAVEQLYGNK